MHEHYRHKLRIMQYRLNLNLAPSRNALRSRTLDPTGQATGYANEQEFLEDLQLIYDSLVAGGDRDLADAGLKDLIRLVQTFGFFLMHLDIRQESTRHTEAISEILKTLPGGVDYASLDEAARQQQLTQALADRTPCPGPLRPVGRPPGRHWKSSMSCAPCRQRSAGTPSAITSYP